LALNLLPCAIVEKDEVSCDLLLVLEDGVFWPELLKRAESVPLDLKVDENLGRFKVTLLLGFS
jgi:hypothetical protein